MLKVLAILFGLVMIIVGILGFLPEYTPGGLLFGIFAVNLQHNIIHLATGVVALLCGFASSTAAKTFFILFGLVYAAVAGLGFYYGEGMLFNLVSINNADNWLHTAIAAVSLYFGFFLPNR